MSLFSIITPGWHSSGEESSGGWDLPQEAWLPIVYWVFAGSCVGYSCCSMANSVLPASIVSAYTCLQPLVGVIFSFILLGEELAWRDLGGLLIIAGLLLTSFASKDVPSLPDGDSAMHYDAQHATQSNQIRNGESDPLLIHKVQ